MLNHSVLTLVKYGNPSLIYKINSKHYFIDASVISPVNVKMRTDKNPKHRASIQPMYTIIQTLALEGQKCLTKR